MLGKCDIPTGCLLPPLSSLRKIFKFEKLSFNFVFTILM